MNTNLLPEIGPATRNELRAALRLALRTSSQEHENTRTEHALHLIESGQFNPAGVLVAREQGRVTGAILCQPLAGASGLIWPVQSISPAESNEADSRLIEAARIWLKSQGA